MEILNHAEFLGAMKSSEALAVWFINDTMKMGTYRLKNHAVKDFWTWVSSWAVSVDKPSDFGYEDGGFILPKLNIIEHVVPVDFYKSAGDKLFRIPALSATDYHKEKRLTAEDRAVKAKEIVDGLDGIVCIWCETNYEADALKTLMPDAVEIRGDDSIDRKEQVALDFAAGKISCLISKPSIFGFGLNFQACHNVVFCGMSYSFEAFYQATRRFWRFGQTKPVDVHIVIGETEKHILDVVQEKEEKYTELKNNMQSAMNQVQELSARRSFRMDYERRVVENSHYKLILGDAIEEIKTIDSESVHFTIFSPPFSTLYMGNNRDDDMFFRHFGFLMEDLHRITIPGRLCAIHCKQLVNYKGRDGQAGLRDFRGDIIRLMQAHGWAYHSEVTIWKDPVIEMQRTKSHGLLYKQLRKDSTFSRQGLPDYLVVFRKWAEDYVDPEPVTHTKEDFELDKWQRYASPVWFDIRQTNVLNIQAAREDGDEKHICPLQLDVIERALELWTNPGDVVFSPFAGIGSEGYGAIKAGRRFLGIELKDKYFDQAVRNLNAAIHTANVPDLFAEAELACTTQD
jgi:hypothetical protein